MKALTLHQPWASLIADGRKTSETRDWAPRSMFFPRSRRGGRDIAIHAGKHVDKYFAARFGYAVEELPIGAVVCVVRLEWWGRVHGIDGCHALVGSSKMAIDDYGNYAVGRWVWRLTEVRALATPAPARGLPGLWDWEPPPGVDARAHPAAPHKGAGV